jgi:ribosomal protein S18 acetylase RimI-like enzyme
VEKLPLTSIRPYTGEDAPAVRRCIVELQEAERLIDPRLLPGESMATPYLEHLLLECADCDGIILVAEADGAVVGFATVLAQVVSERLDDPPDSYAIVTDLAVLESMRRRGIGGALLREAESYARAAGATELRIGVLSENRPARDLYLAAGFVPYVETLSKRLET